ncbi:MAG: hypothetical protein H0U97_01465 [Gammaproteobacteria bacterium]|nr:hypothetical protein [Gammaproteobacteria bacterium]
MPANQHVHELDKFVLEQDDLYMLLFNLIIRHDERLRTNVVEAIQHILQNQSRTPPVPPSVVRQSLQALLDELLKPVPQRLVEVTSAHPVRLVT